MLFTNSPFHGSFGRGLSDNPSSTVTDWSNGAVGLPELLSDIFSGADERAGLVLWLGATVDFSGSEGCFGKFKCHTCRAACESLYTCQD